MRNVSNDYKNYLNTSLSISPKSKIVVDGVEYLGDVIKTSPKLSHSNTAFIGGFPAKTLSFDIFNLNNDLSFENKEITVYKGIVINGTTEWVQQGVFIPQAKDITNNISTKVMTISNAQDKTQLFDGKYTSSLDWENDTTHTGLEIVQEICTRLGVELETLDFAWANYSFKQPNFSETTTDREVISRIAEIGGEIALISCDGGLQIKGQYTTGDTIQRQRYEKLSRENTYSVNTIVLGKNGIVDDIVYPGTLATDRVEFRIEDNPFVDLYRKEMIEQVASHIIGMSYTPFKLDGFIDGFIYELNDVISVVDKNGDTFNAVILDYSTSSRIKANVKAETQDKNTTNYNLAGSKQEAINQVKLLVDHINNEITALAKKVEDITDYVLETTGKGSITLENTPNSSGAIGTLTIKGFTDLTLYPGMVYPSDNIYPGELTSYTIVSTNPETGETAESYFDLGTPLTSSDELIIENSNIYIKNGDSKTDTGIKVAIKTFDNTTILSVNGFNDLTFHCNYLVKNDLTNLFATQVELEALVSIANDKISTKVSRGEVISEINQSAEAVKVNADKINLNGYISNDEGNFEITEEGKAKFVDVTITGGDINLPSGGKVLGGDGILTNLQFSSGDFKECGFSINGLYYNSGSDYSTIPIIVQIPKNFTIESAYIDLIHAPMHWYNGETDKYFWGYSRKVKLYLTDISVYHRQGSVFGEYEDLDYDYTEITGAFGTDGFTAPTPTDSSHPSTTITSNNIKEELSEAGFKMFVLKTTEVAPTNPNNGSISHVVTGCEKTGLISATLNVIGYMKS